MQGKINGGLTVEAEVINCDIFDIVFRHNKYVDITFESNINNIDARISKAKVVGYGIDKYNDNIYILKTDNAVKIISNRQLEFSLDLTSCMYNIVAKSIDFKGIDSSKVINADSMFGNSRIKRIDLSNFSFEQIINLESTFAQLITDKIEIKDKKIRALNMYRTFANCKIDEIVLDNISCKNLKSLRETFAGSEIKRLYINIKNTPYLQEISDMLNSCEIEELVIDNLDLSNVRASRGDMFDTCRIKRLVVKGRELETFSDGTVPMSTKHQTYSLLGGK